VNLSSRVPLHHPLAHRFTGAVDSLGAALAPSSVRLYRGTARNFLIYLGADHPEITALEQLRRDPHILGWMAKLRSQNPPLAPVTYILRLIFLRGILAELAWSAQLPELAQLLRRQDIPRRPRRLPRALSMLQDQLLQQELLRRNDLSSNVLLLLRHTGMRIGEAVDLAFDCLHASGADQWTIHVPLGKLKTERLVPVDSFVCQLVQRLRFFRSLDPRPADGLLLARSSNREALIRKLRGYLHSVCAEAGIAKRIVPHQLRHYAASRTMPRVGARAPIHAHLKRGEAA
jgi:integrase